MKIWETLVGVREDLPSLREKWWHKLAIFFWFVTAFIAFIVATVILAGDPIKPDPNNVFSLSLITFAKGRPGQASHLTELSSLPGAVVGTIKGDQLEPLTFAAPPENIRCESPARYRARQTFVDKDKSGAKVSLVAIPDYEGQPDGEMRHCAASPAYASLVGQQIVSYRLRGAESRLRAGSAAGKGLLISIAWLIVVLNIYYRGIISVWAARRKRRIRNPLHSR